MASKPRRAPYYTDQGPEDGPMLARPEPYWPLDVYDDDGPPRPIGTANLDGAAARRDGAVATFRLQVGRNHLHGAYVVVGRRFVPLNEWFNRERAGGGSGA